MNAKIKKTAAARAASGPAENGSERPAAPRGWAVPGITAVLVLMVGLVFGQTVRHGFVNYDDNQYVYENPVVSKGISLDRLGWAFTHVHAANWHPLTTICHMLNCQAYGLWAGGHHLTSVILHAVAAVLLFLMLRELTGAMWRSAFVAAVFAVHPLRVESVAWVGELKDVLSGVFFMATLLAYARYVRRGPGARHYAMVALWFALGLLSKPMVVTIPCVLLLLDYWPLARLRQASDFPALLREKLPLFALAVASCMATIFAQKEAIQPMERFPFYLRAENSAVAYCAYLGKLIYPVHLAVLYPLPTEGWPAWQVGAAGLLLLLLTGAAWASRKGHPYILMGWLWYLGMLVPVIGLLQVGHAAYADRYTYLPQIGLCLAGTWLVADWARRLRHGRAALGAAAGLMVCALAALAWHQTGYWTDSQALWTHTVACTADNDSAYNNLGGALIAQGRIEEGIAQIREALRIDPNNALAHYDLAVALLQHQRAPEAISHFREALRLNPAFAPAHFTFGMALLQQGQIGEGIEQLSAGERLDPTYSPAHCILGMFYIQSGRTGEGIEELLSAVRIDPNYYQARYSLGCALFDQGREADGIANLEEAVRLQPGNPECLNTLAWKLACASNASLRDGPRAIELATKASQAAGGENPIFLETLAAAYAQTGHFAQATQIAGKALAIADAHSDTRLSDSLRREIALYQAGRAL